MKAIPVLIGLALLCNPVQAQDPPLEVIYTSERGAQAITIFDYERVLLQDANGDGQEDLVMTRRNAMGHLDGVLVIDGSTREEILSMEAELEDEFAGLDLVGFLDVLYDGEGALRPALFAGEDRARLTDLSDGTSNTLIDWGDGTAPHRLVGVGDVTGNGLPELIFILPQIEQMNVWGVRQ